LQKYLNRPSPLNTILITLGAEIKGHENFFPTPTDCGKYQLLDMQKMAKAG
jgi:hypothetical protein